MIRKIEIERFSLTTSKPFAEVVAGVNAAIGHPNMTEFARATHEARSFTELKSVVDKGLSKAGLKLFMQLDQGAVVRKEMGRDVPKIVRLLIGNPLIMKEMAKHVPDAGSYAPVTVLVDERADGSTLLSRPDSIGRNPLPHSARPHSSLALRPAVRGARQISRLTDHHSSRRKLLILANLGRDRVLRSPQIL